MFLENDLGNILLDLYSACKCSIKARPGHSIGLLRLFFLYLFLLLLLLLSSSSLLLFRLKEFLKRMNRIKI
jgi:hypothetical protein